MKFSKYKKFIFGSLAIGTIAISTTATLTSCGGSDKIDDDLKLDLNQGGKYSSSVEFQDTIESAFKNKTSQNLFKTALANEIIYNYYKDKAAGDGNQKNVSVSEKIELYEKEINDSYDDLVQQYKDEHRENWKFFFQNKILSPNGGTEETYKHNQMIDRLRTDFMNSVFTNDYFGLRQEGSEPGIRDANLVNVISSNDLNNPASWDRLGWYAKRSQTFDGGNQYADLQGDFATIQQYVFDKWFEETKPIVSSASLFKYSTPVTSGKNKNLTDIYNEDAISGLTSITNETWGNGNFPFFGGETNGSQPNSSWRYAEFINSLSNAVDVEGNNGSMFNNYYDDGNGMVPNQFMNLDYSDDSQTLLLTSMTDILTETGLVVPYSMASLYLYRQVENYAWNDDAMNILDLVDVQKRLDAVTNNGTNYGALQNDNTAILDNFLYSPLDTFEVTSQINSYIDLINVYGEHTNGSALIFSQNVDDNSVLNLNKKNIAINTFATQVDSNTPAATPTAAYDYTTNFIFELNNYGLHIQTIDGYSYLASPSFTSQERYEARKKALLYRVMQGTEGLNTNFKTGTIQIKDGMKSYFENNLDDVILGMALSNSTTTGMYADVFRPVQFRNNGAWWNQDNFLYRVLEVDEKLNASVIKQYLEALSKFANKKRLLDLFELINSRIYNFGSGGNDGNAASVVRSKNPQFVGGSEFSNSPYRLNAIYSNGINAPYAYDIYTPSNPDWNTVGGDQLGQTRLFYSPARSLFVSELSSNFLIPTDFNWTACQTDLENLISSGLDDEIQGAGVNNVNSGYSPQVKKASDVKSNQFWYRSNLLNRMMYGYAKSTTESGGGELSNQERFAAYDWYINTNNAGTVNKGTMIDLDLPTGFGEQLASAYYVDSVISPDKPYSLYDDATNTNNYFTTISNLWEEYLAKEISKSTEFGTKNMNYYKLLATIKYLITDQSTGSISFENFYTHLSRRIALNSSALIGYIHSGFSRRLDDNFVIGDNVMSRTINDDVSNPKYQFNGQSTNPNNIYDQYGYLTSNTTPTGGDLYNAMPIYDASNTYWRMVDQGYNATLTKDVTYAGFTGLQTSQNNSLIPSQLTGPAFDNISQFSGLADKTGVYFKYVGYGDTYAFNYKNGLYSDTDFWQEARAMAYTIYNTRTVENLLKLASQWAKDYGGSGTNNPFQQVANQFVNTNDFEGLKEAMFRTLPTAGGTFWPGGVATDIVEIESFNRLKDVELKNGNDGYFFNIDNTANGYSMIMTQINYNDAMQKTLHNDISDAEFKYLVVQLAMDSSIQTQAMNDVISKYYGVNSGSVGANATGKAEVWDVNMWNQMDANWVKNWKSGQKIG